MARLQLTLLGGFQVLPESGSAIPLPIKKTQALLAYLALPTGRPHPRDKLATLLWGDMRDEQARANLRQALFALRKALPPGVLTSEGDAIALESSLVSVDALAFEQRVTEGTPRVLEEAAGLYRGDLLAGLAVKENAFEEWLLGERERLRELALEALAKLLAHQRQAGTTEAATKTGLKLLTLDPLQEPAHRVVMRLYVESGRRGAALRQYQQCVGVLARELGIEPEPETKALYREILRRRPSQRAAIESVIGGRSPLTTVETSRAPVAEIPVIGRTAELQWLQAALEQACGGHGSVVAVLGEAGLGKTRLMGELIATAEERGVRALVGRSYESEQVLAFGSWVDAFRTAHVADELRGLAPGLRAELAQLLPEVAAADAEPLKSAPDFLRVFESVTAAIGLLAGHRPLLLVLEDLQWADEMSLRLLAFVGRRLEGRPVLAAVTVREEELADAPMLRRIVGELQRERHLESYTLAALSRDDTLALVHSLARSGLDEALLAQLGKLAWQASAGNPFVVVETVRSQSQGVALEGHAAENTQAAPPAAMLTTAVRQLVTTRLERVSERARLLTTVAAVIGRAFEFGLLRRAAGLGEAEAAEGVEELVRRRVFHGVGERFDFTHDRIREVVRADVLAPRRRVLHRSVAEAIAAVYADNLEAHILALGLHYHGAEMWREAASYLRRAGHHAFVRSAYREASICFEQALAAASHLPRTPQLLDELLDLQLQLRTALWPLAEFDRIAACLEEAERLAAALQDRGRLGRIAAFKSVLRWVTGDVESARSLAQTARDVAASLQDRPLRVMSNYYVGLAHHLLAEYRDAEEAYLENVRTLTVAEEADPLGTPGSTLGRSTAWLVLPLAERGDFPAGLAHGRTALGLAKTAQDPYGIVSADYCLAYLYCLKGEVDLAVPLLERAMAICRERDFGVWLPQITGYLGYAYSQAGRLEEGLLLLEQAMDVFDRTGAWPFRTLLTAHRGAACLLAGRLDSAEALARQALALAREHAERGHEAWALRLLGEIAAKRTPHDPQQAGRYYREALSLATELGMQPLLAHCHLELGKLHGREGDQAQSREHLITAATLYRAMDLGVWLPRAEAAIGPPGR